MLCVCLEGVIIGCEPPGIGVFLCKNRSLSPAQEESSVDTHPLLLGRHSGTRANLSRFDSVLTGLPSQQACCHRAANVTGTERAPGSAALDKYFAPGSTGRLELR